MLCDKSAWGDEIIDYRDALIVNRVQASSVCNRNDGGVRIACHSGPQFGIISQIIAFPLREVAESSLPTRPPDLPHADYTSPGGE